MTEGRDKRGADHPLIELRNLSVSFSRGPAVRSVDLTINSGEAVGIVGESGSGKSVTWLAVLGLLSGSPRIGGEALLHGENLISASNRRLSQIRGGRIGLIFQDPISSLNPVKKVGDQVREALSLHRGMTNIESRAEARRLFDMVGIPDAARRINLYPHELSGGQNQRVMIAMALAGQPELLIADEPTTALDVTIQAQILQLLTDLRRELNMALVLISHDLGVVGEVCDRINVMYAGRIVETAPSHLLFEQPMHPYAIGLLNAAPSLAVERRRLVPIRGAVPEPWNMPPGCAFRPRCRYAQKDCGAVMPTLSPVRKGHMVACPHAEHLPEPLLRSGHPKYAETCHDPS